MYLNLLLVDPVSKRKRFLRKDPSGKSGGTTTRSDEKRRKVYVCDECGVVKTKKNDYDSHMESAHGKGFPCPHCNKVLGYKRNLKKHVKKHSFPRILVCLLSGGI